MSALTRFERLDDMFPEMFRRWARPTLAGFEGPGEIRIDVNETDQGYDIRAEVPGAKKEDIRVTVDGNYVSITAETKREKEEKSGQGRTHAREGAVLRQFVARLHAGARRGRQGRRGQVRRRRAQAQPAQAQGSVEQALDNQLIVFSAKGLTKVYGQGESTVHALRGIDLEIHRGEFVVLLGASGSGKSTLLNILGGLDVPTEGEVRFADHQLTGASEAELTAYRRQHVGFVFQFYNLIPSLTVRENLALVTDIASNPMPIDEAIALVDLTPRRDHFPAQLSGGEQQRVAIARAIVKRPEVLLCDEPTGALDYQTGKLVLDVIARINRELGTTAVVITHNAAIAGMADRVIYLGDGRIQRIETNAHKVAPSELSW